MGLVIFNKGWQNTAKVRLKVRRAKQNFCQILPVRGIQRVRCLNVPNWCIAVCTILCITNFCEQNFHQMQARVPNAVSWMCRGTFMFPCPTLSAPLKRGYKHCWPLSYSLDVASWILGKWSDWPLSRYPPLNGLMLWGHASERRLSFQFRYPFDPFLSDVAIMLRCDRQ